MEKSPRLPQEGSSKLQMHNMYIWIQPAKKKSRWPNSVLNDWDGPVKGTLSKMYKLNDSQFGFGCKVMKTMGMGMEKIREQFFNCSTSLAATQSPLNLSVVRNIITPGAFFLICEFIYMKNFYKVSICSLHYLVDPPNILACSSMNGPLSLFFRHPFSGQQTRICHHSDLPHFGNLKFQRLILLLLHIWPLASSPLQISLP